MKVCKEVDDEKSAQTKVDLNRDLIFPLDTSLLVELVSIWNATKNSAYTWYEHLAKEKIST